jgi:hypothetical protein
MPLTTISFADIGGEDKDFALRKPSSTLSPQHKKSGKKTYRLC